MKLNSPPVPVFIIALALAVIGFLHGLTTALAFIPIPAVWIVLVAFVLLAASCVSKAD
ncbi:hypothetical protein SAMN02983003_1896 [Devosia enhydra]|uniref:Uncharacterized protein n=1 Tax=Devosia enhydra TaxID=665118 RepID=A0A1K2HXA2_9HYPH|nr:hypothetical protein [Devosia enhydra]SFZ84235.1 hypothetical protein SAMN02983003_1896 [Devosia enhydra]